VKALGLPLRLSSALVLALLLLGAARPAGAAAQPWAGDIRMLTGAQAQQLTPQRLIEGAAEARFAPFDFYRARRAGALFWVRLPAQSAPAGAGLPVLLLRHGRHLKIDLYYAREGRAQALFLAAQLPAFSAEQESLFIVPADLLPGSALYARVQTQGIGAEQLSFRRSDLQSELQRGARHASLIALAVGALVAVAVAAALLWVVLTDAMLLYYAALFFLQALYIAYLAGEGFDWPLLSQLGAGSSNAWNVPAALAGAAACLFVREMAELKRFSHGVYRAFGVLAILFAAIGVANFLKGLGIGPLVSAVGNLVFVGTAIFTLVVALLAWRRGNRAAGWFLLAWTLLETCTTLVALRMLVAPADQTEGLLYYGLPCSMVAAALLVALGVAERLRDQRLGLSRAERHATTDALTGVMNRRALEERLQATCARARTRRLPVSLLFIDLDHFKQINDTYGHAAGDACLVATAAAVQAQLGPSDAIGRYGGEEFVVILNGLHGDGARAVANRILEQVAQLSVADFGAPIRLTCSIGVAASDMLDVWDGQLVARADAAVYEAKRLRRNRVQMAPALA
jgi:diguanylate cyclase (GGDEF)-like protein